MDASFTARNRNTPEQKARRPQLGLLIAGSGIKSMEAILELFKDRIAAFVNQGLEHEPDETHGSSMCDFRNKGTDNSRNGHSEKTLKPATATWLFRCPKTAMVSSSRNWS